jgi:hypothetical protein
MLTEVIKGRELFETKKTNGVARSLLSGAADSSALVGGRRGDATD